MTVGSIAYFYVNCKLLLCMKILNYIPGFLKNKYLLTTVGFLVWMFFFDDRDIITTHVKHKQELNELKKSKTYFEQQIALTRKELKDIKNDPTTLEKYAREKYLMKRENEDLFVLSN